MGRTDRSDVRWVDRGEETQGQNPGCDGGEVPQELTHAARPVQVLLFRVGVAKGSEKHKL